MGVTGAVPNITVLIPTYNRASMLRESIESIRAQTLPPAQILVVDDGSTDDTARVLERFGGAVQVLRVQQGGKSAAINAGLPHVTGDYLWIFDDDDVALPPALARLVAPLEANPEAGFSYGRCALAESLPDGRIGPALGLAGRPNPRARGFFPTMLEGNLLSGAMLFARTACYRALGGYDPALIRSQDYDFALRLARSYTGIALDDEPLYLYRRHPGPRGDAASRFGASERTGKWLDYDQIIFRRLLPSLPLSAHLPPGTDPVRARRRAYIHRLFVCTNKLLVDEATQVLREIAALDDPAPLTPDEKGILTSVIQTEPYYGRGSVLDHPGFFTELGALARRHPAVRPIRREVARALVTRLALVGKRRWPAEGARTAGLLARLAGAGVRAPA